jgi:DNA-binding transcriptional ArsR family regulator
MISKSVSYNKISEIFKALSNPTRLCIVHGLMEKGSCNVSYMEKCLETSQSAISQHLSKLKAAGIVKSKRFGNEIHYQIANEKIKRLIEFVFNELISE